MGAVHGGRVVIFGAGGPVGASAAQALREDYTLVLTDARPLAEIAAAGERQSPGAPLPEVLPPPHETRVVDVTRYDEVLEAARGAEAIINCTVVRRDPEQAFRVNLVGAYHVATAAVELGIRRLIHTGPYHTGLEHNADTWWEHDVSPDGPLHPGSEIYAVSKFLGGEVTRVFAEERGLEVVTFLYCAFRPGEGDEAPDGSGVHPFTTSWEDCGEAFLYGLRAPELPRPYEPFFVCSDLPHGKYRTEKAKQLLGFEPRHRFERLWTRTGERDA